MFQKSAVPKQAPWHEKNADCHVKSADGWKRGGLAGAGFGGHLSLLRTALALDAARVGQ
jgi:hypothetical protein